MCYYIQTQYSIDLSKIWVHDYSKAWIDEYIYIYICF